jgi:hypothetical protein
LNFNIVLISCNLGSNLKNPCSLGCPLSMVMKRRKKEIFLQFFGFEPGSHENIMDSNLRHRGHIILTHFGGYLSPRLTIFFSGFEPGSYENVMDSNLRHTDHIRLSRFGGYLSPTKSDQFTQEIMMILKLLMNIKML